MTSKDPRWPAGHQPIPVGGADPTADAGPRDDTAAIRARYWQHPDHADGAAPGEQHGTPIPEPDYVNPSATTRRIR